MTLRKRIHEIIQPAAGDDWVSRLFDLFILSLIALNVASIVLESDQEIRDSYSQAFWRFELFSVVVFTAEYVLRLWTCVEEPRHARPVAGRIRAALSPLLLIDLLAILPFYLPFFAVDLRFLRSLRLFRVFRVAKVARYSTALQTIGRVMASRRSELLVTAFAMGLLLILSATLMYYVENEAQPESFSSIPATMWWAVTTMTTVGYGDACPITPLGKVLASFIAILGIGMFAVPTGILGAGFTDEMRRKNAPPRRCPHCGGDLPPE